MSRSRSLLLLVAAVGAGCSAAASAGDTSRALVSDGGGEAGDASDARSGPAPDATAPAEGGDPADAVAVDSGADGSDAPDALDGDAGQVTGIDCDTDADHPVQLGCTGLYSDWPSRTIAPGVRAYAPAVALWSDGAQKQRWVALPPGTRIDTTNPDEWVFPVGTRLWKKFSLGGKLVETRFLWKRAPGVWLRTTYAWSSDGSSATELTTGRKHWNGTSYEIPPQTACTACHQGSLDGVLGFELVGLSIPGATGLTMGELVSEGLVTSAPPAVVVPGDTVASGALAWLHANCGNACHNRTSRALASATGLFMKLRAAGLDSIEDTDTWKTAVGQPSNFQPTQTSDMLRIDPGNPGNSAIYFRDSFRDDQGQDYQMPPIDSHVVPTEGVPLVQAWIASMPPTSPDE